MWAVLGGAQGSAASEKTLQAPQWHARDSRVQATARIAASPAPLPDKAPVNRAVLQWTSRGKSPRQARVKLRDSILRVNNYEEAETPAADEPAASDDSATGSFPAEFDDADFAADEEPIRTSSQPADAADSTDSTEPTDAPPAAQALPMPDSVEADGEPTPLTPAQDLYKDPIPTPPDYEQPLMPDNLSEGISTPPGGPGCKDYDKDCRRALDELQRRDITKIIVDVVIEGTEGEDFPCDCKVGRDFEVEKFAGRNFSPTLFTWKASGQCHKPLYFEDVQLERYGHSWNPFLQPFLSGAHFFVSVPLLPYKMGLRTPNECVYTLGYYRPGSCAPYMLEPIPLSLRAAVWEAWGVTAFTFWFWPPN